MTKEQTCNEVQQVNLSSIALAHTVERLKETLHYDPETGVFTGKVARGNISVGKKVGGLHGSGYSYFMVDGKRVGAHRLAWLYTYGVWPKKHLDHINGDRNDNRIVNLREATNAENHQNRKKPKNNTSGYMGVTYHKGQQKWYAQISVENKRKYLGSFETPEEAFDAYLNAKKLYHPFNTVLSEYLCETKVDYSSIVIAHTVKALTGMQSTMTGTSGVLSAKHTPLAGMMIKDQMDLEIFFNRLSNKHQNRT